MCIDTYEYERVMVTGKQAAAACKTDGIPEPVRKYCF